MTFGVICVSAFVSCVNCKCFTLFKTGQDNLLMFAVSECLSGY